MALSSFNKMRKTLVSNQPELYDTQLLLRQSLYNRIRNKPFWIWDKEAHKQADIDNNGDCCFNHIIGLPKKDDVDKPLFPYQKIILDTLDKTRYLYVLKAAGLGISELLLRYMSYLCIRDDTYRGTQMAIITGPRIDLSVTLMDRMKALFEPSGIFFNTKETLLELNGCTIEVYPSHHLDSMRGLSNLKFILADESDFFPAGQWQDCLLIVERYIGKSNPYICLVSTPNKPAQMMETLHKQKDSIYTKIYLPYTVGLNTIYSKQDMINAQKSLSFQREYNLTFSGGMGSLFNIEDLDRCKKIGALVGNSQHVKANPQIMMQSWKSVGIDLGYGSSATAIVVTGMYAYYNADTNMTQDVIQVLHSEQWEHASHETIINNIMEILADYNITEQESAKIYVDASGVAAIRSLKANLGDKEDYYRQLDFAKKNKFNPVKMMKVVPVTFSTSHKEMLQHMRMLIQSGYVGIDQSHEELLIGLGSAVEKDLSLQKDQTVYDDQVDAARLALWHYHTKNT